MLKFTLITAAIFFTYGAAAATEKVELTLHPSQPGPVINKDIYGQFAEHLGTGIYGGMWVGPGSPIPNTRGWRNDVVAALKNLHVPLIRWPGGCFADTYHWQDGIGARKLRPLRDNGSWGGEETNAVCTHEFFDLTELIGADAYVNGNLGSGTVQEMSEWLEYMTSTSKSTLAQLRRKNGHEQPFKIAYFALGNEAWGCGGNMSPESYSDQYKKYASFLRLPHADPPILIASGGNGDDTSWSDVLSKNLKGMAGAVSFHYYTLPTADWTVKGSSTGFSEQEWAATLANTLKIESLIKNNIALLDKNDPEKKLGFDIDEWGTWYDPEAGKSTLFQQNTLRDAIVAALNFNIFHAHADRVRMTNIAQMVNVLQAMILTDGKQMLLTPTYHAFNMFVPFQGATSIPATITNNPEYKSGSASMPSLSVSAALGKDGKLYLSMVNVNPTQGLEVVVGRADGSVTSADGSLLTAGSMDAHNTFTDRQAVRPVKYHVTSTGNRLIITLPPKAIAVVELH